MKIDFSQHGVGCTPTKPCNACTVLRALQPERYVPVLDMLNGIATEAVREPATPKQPVGHSFWGQDLKETGFSPRVVNCLGRAKVDLSTLKQMSDKQLLALKRSGRTMLNEVRERIPDPSSMTSSYSGSGLGKAPRIVAKKKAAKK